MTLFASLVREGSGWVLSVDGRRARIPHTRGIAYVAWLLARPGRVVSASDLVRHALGAATAGAPEPERDRLRVRKSIQSAITRIARRHKEVAHHLRLYLQTGRRCVYVRPPRRLVVAIDVVEGSPSDGFARP